MHAGVVGTELEFGDDRLRGMKQSSGTERGTYLTYMNRMKKKTDPHGMGKRCLV